MVRLPGSRKGRRGGHRQRRRSRRRRRRRGRAGGRGPVTPATARAHRPPPPLSALGFWTRVNHLAAAHRHPGTHPGFGLRRLIRRLASRLIPGGLLAEGPGGSNMAPTPARAPWKAAKSNAPFPCSVVNGPNSIQSDFAHLDDRRMESRQVAWAVSSPVR